MQLLWVLLQDVVLPHLLFTCRVSMCPNFVCSKKGRGKVSHSCPQWINLICISENLTKKYLKWNSEMAYLDEDDIVK